MFEKESMPSVYCSLMMEQAAKDPRIVVIENDLAHAQGTHAFQEKFPDRFLNVGVAEANSICVGAGLAAQGYIPFVASLVSFITRRCYDQITISVAYSGLNVKIVGTRPGITSEMNGGTHFGIDDAGIMRNLPGFTVVDATDNTALRQIFPQIIEMDTPVYLRFGGAEIRKIYNDNDVIKIGKANTIKEGKDLTIIANDLMVGFALDATEILAESGIDAGVIDMHTIKPIDKEAILKAAEIGPILTAENHSIYNGLGSAVAEVLCENGCGVKMNRFGVNDCFGVVGTQDEIAEILKMRPCDMADAAKKLLKKDPVLV